MPQSGEGSALPKTGKSKDWLAYADQKLAEFRDYHSQRNILGQIKNPGPLQDDFSKLLSQNELSARKMGMDLLRKETKEQSAKEPSYKKGGVVRKTGRAKLHRGEAVARKRTRKSPRSGSRR